ncbi:MAG: hypothetical protein H7239_10320 [Flavobacterium sp.]|nr:hypothetical protein [Flavobacterium sp.]
MKILKNLFRTIEQKSKLDLITELLIVQNSTPEALDLFEKVKANFMFEMTKREKQAAYECRLINSLELKPKREYDANFYKPISEIETNYETINIKNYEK